MQISTLKQLDFFKDKNLISLDLLKNQGYCNFNYKLVTKGTDYLVREFKNSDSVNISRSFEFKTQKLAARQKLAPIPFVLDLKNKLMITQFLKGSHKQKLKNIELIKLVRAVKKVHSIKIKSKPYNLKKDFIFYNEILKNEESKKLIRSSFKELVQLKKYKKEYVLTHHDLNPKNIIFYKNSIKIIDWEYAGVNDLFFDLASLCCEFNLSKKEQSLLLKTYFKKTHQRNIKKLNSYKIIYKNLCILWFKSLEQG